MSLTAQRSMPRPGTVVIVVLLHAALFYGISNGLNFTKIVKPLESMVTVMVPEDPPAEEPPPPVPQPTLPDAPIAEIAPPEPLPVEIAPEVPVQAENAAAITTAPQEAVPAAKSFSIQSRVDPTYPPASRRAGEQGRVLLELIVGPNGKPTEVKILRSSGFPMLDESAVMAVRKWKFSVNNGGSAYSRLQLPVTFKLETVQ